MSARSLLVIVLALVCGGSAALGLSRLRGTAKPVAVEVAPETAPVIVAKANITRGQTVSADAVEQKPWPKKLVPPQALSQVDQCVERAALGPILAGEPLMNGKLAPKNSGRGLAALIPKGMRAYTIQTSRVAANVAGFILPNNRVDVLLTLRGGNDEETGGGTTVTLLQAVEILAVDQQLDAPADNKVDPKPSSSVTLLVNPEQATALDLGQNMGTLTLSLRNPNDTSETIASPTTVNLLRMLQKRPNREAAAPAQLVAAPVEAAPPAPEPQPEVYEIRTLRGSQSGRVYVSPRQPTQGHDPKFAKYERSAAASRVVDAGTDR